MRRYGGVILLQIGEADASSTNIPPYTFFSIEFFMSGKDAGRRGHDAKPKGAPDRTKRELDDDYDQ